MCNCSPYLVLVTCLLHSQNDVADDTKLDQSVQQSHFFILDVHNLGSVILKESGHQSTIQPLAGLQAATHIKFL